MEAGTVTPEEIPPELVGMLDADAGKTHSATGRVLTSLARILTRYDEIRSCDVAGYAVLSDEPRPGGPRQTEIAYWPATLYENAAQAQREARRAQAHAEIDADLNERIPAYSIAEVRRVKGAP
jgi:hypothetical protein